MFRVELSGRGRGKKCFRHIGRQSQETLGKGTEVSASCGPKTMAVLVRISDI